MSGGIPTKEAKERMLKEDIEEHRQRTLGQYGKEYKKNKREFEKKGK